MHTNAAESDRITYGLFKREEMEKITGFQTKVFDNLEYLATIDSCAWQSFKKIKDDNGPNPYNFLKAFSVMRIARAEKRHLKPYFLWLVTAHILAVAFALTTEISFMTFLTLFILSLVGLFRSWFPYKEEYFRQKSGRENPLSYAFGTNNAATNIALFSKYFTESLHAINNGLLQKIKSKDFDALIKLNKAAQDKEEVNFGIADVVKKSTYGAILLAFVKFDFSGITTTLSTYSAFATNIKFQTMPLNLWLYLAVIFGSFTYFIYDLFLGQSKLKRKKKQYLLLLNVLKESWVDPVEPSSPKATERCIEEGELIGHLRLLPWPSLARLVWLAVRK